MARAWCRARVAGLVLLCLLGVLVIPSAVSADLHLPDSQVYDPISNPLPPFTGDLIVDAGGSPTITGYTGDSALTLPASIFVYGHLTLNNCMLRLDPVGCGDKGFFVYGSMDAAGVDFTTPSATIQKIGRLYVEAGVNTFTGCTFDYVRACFTGASDNTIDACTFRNARWWVVFAGDSHNTLVDTVFEASNGLHTVFGGNSVNSATRCDFLTGWTVNEAETAFNECTFKLFEFHSPSVSSLNGCTFSQSLSLSAEGDTALHLQDLAPGHQENTHIQSSTNPFSVSLVNTDVPVLRLCVHGDAQITLDRCTLSGLDCHDYSQTTVTDSTIENFFVVTYQHFIGQGGVLCPDMGSTVNISVDGFRDGGVPVTTDITSDNTNFHVTLTNTTIQASWWLLGDNGGPTGSENWVRGSTINQAQSLEDATLHILDSTINYSGVGGGPGVPAKPPEQAQVVAERSTLGALHLDGPATTGARLWECHLGALGFWDFWHSAYPALPPSAPLLTFEGESNTLGGYAYVGPGVTGARITGKVVVDPSSYVDQWGPDSTVTREYPVQVLDEGVPLAGVTVLVRDAQGNVLDTDVTSGDPPTAYLEVEFNYLNCDSEFRVELDQMGYWGSAPLRFLSSTPIQVSRMKEKLSWTSFEEEHYPWSAFAVGPGAAATWRRIGSTAGAPPAHSGAYLMAAELEGQALTGLRLSIPTSPSSAAVPEQYTLRTWANLTQATSGNTSAFIGLLLEDEAKNLDLGLPFLKVGWEVHPRLDSYFRVGGASYHLAETLTPTGWHLVEVSFTRATGEAELKLDGRSVTGLLSDLSLVGAQAYWAILAAQGNDGSARQHLAFDDASLAPKWPTTGSSLAECLWPYAILAGGELAVSGEAQTATLRYGNGYPMLGKGSAPGPPDRSLWVRLDFPADYTLDLTPETGTLPPPDRVEGGAAIWQLPFPGLGEEGTIHLKWQTPGGLPSARADLLTASAAGLSYEPTNWGTARDLLPQLVLPGEQKLPDLWVEKTGPDSVSPGDRFRYQIRVVNRGFETAENVVVRDELPPEMKGPAIPDAQPGDLAPGGRWEWWPLCTLDWGTSGEKTNTVRVWGDNAAEKTAECTIEIVQAKDPNSISVVPDWQVQGVDRHETLTYTLECENVGAGTAYGVYATAELDAKVDDGTLSLPDDMSYDPASRTLLWEVGTLASGAGASTTFSVEVAGTARRARPVIGQATVYFPSVPEETRTNVVANTIVGSFPDVSWDHGALLPVELAYENGVVTGYGDGTYRPAVVVKRDQMAVYIARSLCGGDAHVPSGPAEPTFTDVLGDYWAYRYIEYCVAEHIVVGYSDVTYRPANEVNRAQMAAYVARAIYSPRGIPPDDLPGYVPPLTPSFPDVATDHAFYKHVEYIVGAGVVQGYPDGTYRPADPVNRGQMAIYVARAFALPM